MKRQVDRSECSPNNRMFMARAGPSRLSPASITKSKSQQDTFNMAMKRISPATPVASGSQAAVGRMQHGQSTGHELSDVGSPFAKPESQGYGQFSVKASEQGAPSSHDLTSGQEDCRSNVDISDNNVQPIGLNGIPEDWAKMLDTH